MPNKTGTNATNAPALPKLDAIEAVAVADLPAPATKSSDLNTDEKALAAAIIERTAPAEDGSKNAARGPVQTADKPETARDQATSAAARIKRLLVRYQKAENVTDPIAFTSRVVARDGGFSWVILRADAKPAAEAPTEGAAEGSAG